MKDESGFLIRLSAGLFSCGACEVTDEKKDAKAFEEKYCFRPQMQPFFTEDGLLTLFSSMKENTFYILEDKLHLAIVLFCYRKKIFLIGPFAISPFTEAAIDKNTADIPLSLSQRRLLYVYCSSFPVTGTEYVTNTMQSIFLAMNPDTPAYAVRFLKGFYEDIKEPEALNKEEKDIQQIELIREKYEVENRLLGFIRHGETEKALREFRHMTREYTGLQPSSMAAIYQNPLVSMSILRALWRKAAEEGGLSVVTIDELTQLQVQKSASAKTMAEQIRSMDGLLKDLCEAVRETRLQTVGCSKTTKAVLEYIDLHLAEDIRIEDLTALTGYSKSQLSASFKADTGCTVSAYIAQKRCEKAGELLSSTSLPIQDISLRVGYPDNNYFIKVFKKQYGMTPSAYRRKK